MKLTSRRGLGAGQKVDGRTARFRQLAWASVPLWSFGFLAYAPFLYLAVIRRRIRDWAVFVAYLAAWILVMTAVSAGGSAGAFSWVANLLVPLVGLTAVHAFIAFRPDSAPASWPDAHALTNVPDLGAGQKLVDRTGRFRQLAWASVPLWSFGFFAFAPFLYLAVIRRRIRDWAVFAAYLAACTLVMTAIYAGRSAGAFSWVAVLLILLVGLAAVHAFIVLRPGGSLLPPWRDVDAAGCVSADPGVHAGLAVEVVDGPCAGTALAWNHAEIGLGRGAEGSELFACDPEISERHAIVRRGPDGFCVVESIGSAGGIFVNGVCIDGPTQMRPGDELRVGRTRLRVTSVTSDPVSVVVPSAEPVVNGPSGAPHEPGPSRGMPGVLRADPVQLWKRMRGVWWYEKVENGWLILTVTGEVRFYERLPADMAATPDLSAPSTTEFAQGIGDTGIRAHFGEQKRNVVFTGAKPRALSAEKLEEAGTTEESLANLGDSSGDRSLSVGGDAAALASYTLQAVRAISDRKRKLAAMRAWYPVLLGEQPWPMIEAGPPMDVNWEQRAQHLHKQDQQALGEAADQLAVTVGAQWGAEATIWSLNDPYPLPVRWVAADASLANGWDVLVRLAGSGTGWPSPPPPGTWATGPDELAGSGNHLVKVLAQVPTGRLVVLGEPGAGKTMQMVRLVLDLLASRTSGAPVPVLASLASWNPAERDLHGWLADQLAIDYPALAAEPGMKRPDQIAALLSAGLILPILDGLDEIPDELRRPAINQINDSLRPGGQLIMTCRTGPYRKAARPPDGAGITVRAAAVIQLCPLDADDVSRYLRDDFGGVGASARWDPVLAILGTQAPAGQVLVTPLMLSLARTIYNPRPGERNAELRDPAELCRCQDQAAVEAHLFDAFIPAAYRSRPPGRWDARQAEAWLAFLARHLETTIGTPDLAWWQLAKAGPSARLKLATGLAAAVVVGVAAGLITGLAAGLTAGLTAGLLFGFGGVVGSAVAAARKKYPKPLQGKGQRFTAVYAILFYVFVSTLFAVGLRFGHWLMILAAYLIGFVIDFIVLRRVARGGLDAAASPRGVLRRDRAATLYVNVVFGFLFVLLFGIIAGIIVWVLIGPVPGFVFGFAFPNYLGFYLSLFYTAWPSCVLVRGWLALHRRLPWSLMDFLADAHQRGILRQAGSVYQFRNIDLQHRLATRPGHPPVARKGHLPYKCVQGRTEGLLITLESFAMGVTVIIRFPVSDVAKAVEGVRAHASLLEKITESTKNSGNVHRRVLTGDGEPVALEEWEPRSSSRASSRGARMSSRSSPSSASRAPTVSVFSSVDMPGTF